MFKAMSHGYVGHWWLCVDEIIAKLAFLNIRLLYIIKLYLNYAQSGKFL